MATVREWARSSRKYVGDVTGLMIIQLTEDYEIHNERRDDKVQVIPTGMKITAINYSYLPSYYKDDWPEKTTVRDYYIVYYRAAFHRLPKSICSVAICEGWLYNY